MKEENKKEIKKNVITGVSTASGAVIGTVIENTLNPVSMVAEDIIEPEILDVNSENIDEGEQIEIPDMKSDVASEAINHHEARTTPNVNDAIPSDQVEVIEQVDVIENVDDSIETEVLSEMNSDEDEEQPIDEDIPVVSIQQEVEVIPVDELVITPESAEMEDILAQNILQDETDMKVNDLGLADSGLAMTDMPDYVNDANIDSFTE